MGTDVLTSAEYFVTLSLESIDDSVSADHVPPKAPSWIDVSEDLSPVLQRLDPSAKNLLFGGRHPQPKRPWFEAEPSQSEDETSRELALAERRRLPEMKLRHEADSAQEIA